MKKLSWYGFQIQKNHFTSFMDRGAPMGEQPLPNALVNLNGERWRNCRSAITPAFTSHKLRMVRPIALDRLTHCALLSILRLFLVIFVRYNWSLYPSLSRFRCVLEITFQTQNGKYVRYVGTSSKSNILFELFWTAQCVQLTLSSNRVAGYAHLCVFLNRKQRALVQRQ